MFNCVPAGINIPYDMNVIIEIPAHSEPVKYEVDKNTGTLFVDRFMSGNMRYPCDYGYIPHTLAEDGDPVDVLVVSPVPLLSGSVIRVRPIGLLRMTDEAGKDSKILAVPVDKLTKLYSSIQKPQDLFPLLLEQISHFFAHYKDLEENKWVKVEGWEGIEAAEHEILAGIKRYANADANAKTDANADIHTRTDAQASSHLSQSLMVFCTCPSYEIASEIAKKVVEMSLAACVNIMPGLTSIYTWEGKTENSTEVLLLLKTTESVYPRLEQSLIHLHPHDCPEIIGVPIQQGYIGYLKWLNNSVS